MKQCKRCNTSLSLVNYFRHRLECRTRGRTCVHCHKNFEVLSSYHLHIATCLKRLTDKQRMKNQLKNFLPSRGLMDDEKNGIEFSKEEAIPLKGPNYSTLCSLCNQSFRSVHLFRLHLAREGLCRPKPYICHTCNREFMSSYHLLSHEKRKKPCMPKNSTTTKAGLKVKFVRKKPKDMKTSHLNHILNSESSNSVTSEGDFSPIKSKNFYQQKTDYEHQRFLGSAEQYSADKILKQQYICKVCSFAFADESELQTHCLVSPSCAIKDQVPDASRHTSSKQSEMKQTARKSFSNAANVIRNEVPLVNSQNQEHSLLTRVAYGGKLVGEDGFLGSARKSSQDSLVQVQRNSQNEKCMVCNICAKSFPDFQSLQVHKKVHSVQKEANGNSKCTVCFQVFSNAFLLFGHQKKHQHWGKSAKSKTTGCKCPFCDKIFLYVRSRNAHLRGHEDVDSESIENFLKKTTCEVCSLAFVSENQKIYHRKAEHPDWTDALPKLFSNFDLRNQETGKRNHDVKKQETSQNKLPIPSKKVKVLVNITPSLKAKLKAHPNTCPICFKQYSTTFVRNRHFRMHVLDKAFECKWCPIKFHRSEPLNAHMQKEHNDKLAFECLVCNLRYLTKFRLLQHITKSHNSQTPQKYVKERQVVPYDMKNNTVSFKNGNISTNSVRTIAYEGKTEYNKPKSNQEFYCEVCETSFLKLCGLQRHRQSKNHKDILATKDQQSMSITRKEESPPPVVSSPCPEEVEMVENIGELSCSVCLRLFTGIIEFVPHRLSHFHHTGLSEINEINPYTCEICSVSVDHHQKVQWHLLHHLQSAKSKKASLPQWRFNFVARSPEPCPIRVSNVRLEKSVSLQVAKKTINYKAEKPIQKEVVPSGAHRGIFTCDACNVVFTTKHHYSAHVRRYCPVRKAAMSTEEQVELETSPNNSRNKWRLNENYPKLHCHYCSLEFGTVDELGWHEKSCRKVNGPVNGSMEGDEDEFFYCKACECLFPFEHSYEEHRKLFCLEEESVEKLHSNLGEDNLSRLRSAIEYEAAVACCVRCGMVFLTVEKLSSHMACHFTNSKQFVLSAKEENTILEDSNDMKAMQQEQNSHQMLQKTSESSGKVSFNIADILSDSGTSKKCENVESVSKVAEGNIRSDGVVDLRTDFAHLLYYLVADHELMQQLGWGQRPIELVLNDVLKHMGHIPVTSEQVNCESDRLRQNIQVLLESCLSDDIMTNASGSKKTVDTIVTEVLQMCRAQTNNVSVLPNRVNQINV